MWYRFLFFFTYMITCAGHVRMCTKIEGTRGVNIIHVWLELYSANSFFPFFRRGYEYGLVCALVLGTFCAVFSPSGCAGVMTP